MEEKLTRQVLPPREALCDSCLGSQMRHRHNMRLHIIWIAAVVIAALGHYLTTWWL